MTASAWVVAVAGGIITFLLRFSFLAAAQRLREVSPAARTALRMIPPAALAALVAPAVLRPEGPIAIISPEVAAAAAAMVVMWRTGNVLATLAVGLGVVVLLGPLL